MPEVIFNWLIILESSCNEYDERAVVLAWLEIGGVKLEDVEEIIEENSTKV